MSIIEINIFTDSYLDAIHDLIQETIESSYAGLYPPRAVQYFKAFNTREAIISRSLQGTMLVAKDAGEIIGTGCVTGNEISTVFVAFKTRKMELAVH